MSNNNDPFLTICKKADGYYTYSYTDVTYASNWGGYKRYVSISNKLVINTSKGVEDYAFLYLTEDESNHIENIKVRTLKADGTIVNLDSSLVFKRDSKKKKFGEIKYPIPGVEPGDTIETNYVYSERLNRNGLKNYVSLQTELPSLNSQYSVKAHPEMMLRYKAYNGFPEPSVVTNDSLIYAQFSMDKVKGIVKNDFNCLPCEKPYLYYSLDKKGSELITWKKVYNEEFNFATQPFALDYDRFSYYKRWKRRVIGKAKDSSKYYKFNLLHAEVLKNFKMEPAKVEDLIKSSGYFLKEKRFDPISIRRFYRQILEDLEIDYWAVFARTKHLGAISKHYIRKGEFDHIFFAFEDEKENLVFLYPHEDYFRYQINEVPTSIYNTDIILVKPHLKKKRKKKDKFISRDLQLAKVDSVAVKFAKLPGMNSNINYGYQVVSSKVDIEKKETTFKSRFKVSGGLSTELRSFYGMLNKNEEVSKYYDALNEFKGIDTTLDIDTVTNISLNGKKPFVFKINSEGTLNNVVTFINDSLISISVDKLVSHNQLEGSSDSDELSYYLDYGYSDLLTYYINFPSDIEVLGSENSDLNFENNFGKYSFEFKKTNNKQIRLKSEYTILKDLIPFDKRNEIELLNEKVKAIKNKRFVIKLKNTKS
ncbi:DUF3857 domain-containing protein [Tenacibaculum sp. MEBiC06402]|uniref:DUF3857 domain-containing protein n=1 Tax=unclassified Tenacibaculum TaxID=2635139 RepID=UPI003B9CC0FB